MKRLLFAAAALFAAALAQAQPTLSIVPNEQMRLNIASSTVAPNGSQWNLNLVMQNDNNVANGVLPFGFRRWWHVEIGNLDPAGETLNVQVTNTEYSDFITPVWSLDGGRTYHRLPNAGLSVVGSNHFFTVQTPPGVTSIRLSKYFPYTLAMYDAWRAPLASHPFVTEESIGQSVQGRDIWMYTLTDPNVPDAGKQRVWIHSAVHPAETTSFFNCEGLIDWLTGGSHEANTLMANTIFNVVPMANPDGVALGNYRVNANSVNLENEWGFPYGSTVAEIVALRSKIEEFMSTPGNPGSNPIRVVLNIHSSHGLAYPFHFVHASGYPPSGVIQAVRDLELDFVNAFRARSPFVDAGTNQNSTLGGSRPFVESMMHDRYTINGEPAWTPVMAITFEGTYELFPARSTPNTPDDYRLVGLEMGLALADYFGIDLTLPPAETEAEWDAIAQRLTITTLHGGDAVLSVDSGNLKVNGNDPTVSGVPTAVPASALVTIIVNGDDQPNVIDLSAISDANGFSSFDGGFVDARDGADAITNAAKGHVTFRPGRGIDSFSANGNRATVIWNKGDGAETIEFAANSDSTLNFDLSETTHPLVVSHAAAGANLVTTLQGITTEVVTATNMAGNSVELRDTPHFDTVTATGSLAATGVTRFHLISGDGNDLHDFALSAIPLTLFHSGDTPTGYDRIIAAAGQANIVTFTGGNTGPALDATLSTEGTALRIDCTGNHAHRYDLTNFQQANLLSGDLADTVTVEDISPLAPLAVNFFGLGGDDMMNVSAVGAGISFQFLGGNDTDTFNINMLGNTLSDPGTSPIVAGNGTTFLFDSTTENINITNVATALGEWWVLE